MADVPARELNAHALASDGRNDVAHRSVRGRIALVLVIGGRSIVVHRLARGLIAIAFVFAFAPAICLGGAQQYEPLEDSVRARLHATISDRAVARLPIADPEEASQWLRTMSARLSKYIPNPKARDELLVSVHYEATRAGLDPQLILGLIDVESRFKKYAVSSAGARGYMQVMPFWPKVIGSKDHNLFHLRTNLRYGCTILRHYLDIEKGHLQRALARYNGSLGKSDYPNRVERAWARTWRYRLADATQ